MSPVSLIPAAQYLRMSTEHQNFSLENQRSAIQSYAESNNFSVVKTYVDAGRSGVVLNHRAGLAQLLHDVLEGNQQYRVILVYDVSRWGRFQDTDEAAYYEFLCKRAGVPMHYCAEAFSNDPSMPNTIMKALKRAMAAEYSRELGVKTLAGQERLALLGFRQGGQPGYGLRRLLVSADGTRKHFLDTGQRKSIANDRVIQVLGPAHEVRCVKEIYEMFIQKNMTFKEIARELNRRRIKCIGGARWNPKGRSVSIILTHPKYTGFNVFGRSTKRLYTPSENVPRSGWTLVAGAFEPLIEPELFAAAQRIVKMSSRNISDDCMLDVLRACFVKNGKLSIRLMKNTVGIPSAHLYRRRFGSLSRAYELVGYDGSWRVGEWLKKRRSGRGLREDLINKIVSLSDGQVLIEDRGPAFRKRLRMNNGQLVSVVASPTSRNHEGRLRWLLKPVFDECLLTTLIARFTEDRSAFKDLYVIPPFCSCKPISLKENDPRLYQQTRLNNLGEFLVAVQSVSASGVLSFSRYLPR